ncbi:hypothetical protein QFC20_003939 [Naganishia adeliensis]|uniref:Uncharacterized protein n=1 Tax=Naganishia adeliensis TaxID=92952 RepID=A0ACC2W5B2_9TREE|nr:hypothetical protein QFC20_003939 [Naganishia adeliensis]
MKISTISIRGQLVQPQRYARAIPVIRSTAILQSSIRQPSTSLQRRTFFSLADVAKLLPNQQTEKGVSGQDYEDPNSQRVHVRKILPYTQEQLYKIVADVPSYSSFIPFCTTSAIVSPSTTDATSQLGNSADPFDVKAELQVGFGNFAESYTSRVQGVPFESVKATVNDSPLFHNLQSTWSFQPASSTSPHSTTTPLTTPSASPSANSSPAPTPAPSAGPTMLTIDLSFSFASPLHRMAAQAFLPKVQDLMIEAFEKRCVQVYGKGHV